MGILKSNHDIKFSCGHDSELENDYQSMIDQKKKSEEVTDEIRYL
ncbi:hypothetical protein [Streptococcus canis]|nr:hypothetical protein [Streptococcus canis]GFE43857.1 hypothetical protein ScFU1_15380 [Streptococcus canis]